MRQQQLLPLPVKVDLGVMKMKAYAKLSRFSELEPDHHFQLIVTSKTPSFGGLGCGAYLMLVQDVQ